MRCAGLSVVAILLSALAPQRVLSQVAASGQVEPAGFAKCIAELEHHARSSGISNATTDHLTGLSSDPDVLGAVQSQAEFEMPIWEYVDANVSEARISTGRGKLAEWAGPLDAIEARFGVDRHILVAIWGIESTFGAVLDDPGIVRSVVRSALSPATMMMSMRCSCVLTGYTARRHLHCAVLPSNSRTRANLKVA